MLTVRINKISEENHGWRTLEKAIIASAISTIVRMWGNGHTCVLRVRGMQTAIDILVLSEIKPVYSL